MSEYDDDFVDSDTDHLDPNIRAELRKSKERAKDAAEARAELDSLKRELAFTKAGIPETGTGALLRKAYDGDFDTEAIRKAAEEYGVLSDQAQEHNPINDELAAHRQIQGSTGTSQSGPTAQQELLAALEEGTSKEEIMSIIAKMGAASGVYATGMQ